jgi:hypothetical protein
VDGQLATQKRCYTTGLGSAEGNADEIGTGFPMLEAIGENAERKGLDVRDRLIARCPVGEDTLEVRDLGDPATIVFAVNFEGEMHGSLERSARRGLNLSALPQSSKEVLLSAERPVSTAGG